MEIEHFSKVVTLVVIIFVLDYNQRVCASPMLLCFHFFVLLFFSLIAFSILFPLERHIERLGLDVLFKIKQILECCFVLSYTRSIRDMIQVHHLSHQSQFCSKETYLETARQTT